MRFPWTIGAGPRNPRLDASTHAVKSIEYEHAEIHSGSSFHCWYEQEVSDTGDKSIIAFKTDNTAKWCHVTFSASASSAAEAYILEAPTITDNTGATLTVFNRNRNSANTSGVWDTSVNPDVQGQAMYFTEATMGSVTAGTELDHQHLQAGSGGKAVGGVSRGSQEWEFLPNTLYAFVVESLNDTDNTHSLQVNWYEHTDKN